MKREITWSRDNRTQGLYLIRLRVHVDQNRLPKRRFLAGCDSPQFEENPFPWRFNRARQHHPDSEMVEE